MSLMASCFHMYMKNEHSAFFFEHFFFLFYDCNLNTQCFAYLEFVKYQLGLHRNVVREMQCIHICYTFVLYTDFTDMSRLSPYIEINRLSFRC